ncbi:MAG: glycosyltransferase [Humidesulfovibrio sp.]|nr:glycosyltransferase [Humidesulfovibrio sp.]
MSSFSFARIAGVHYPRAIEHFYETTPGAEDFTYTQLQEKFFHGSYVYGDSITHGMRELGHESHEIVYDFFKMQQRWAWESGIRMDEETRAGQIRTVLDQIRRFRPEVVFFQDIYALPKDIRATLKDRFPFIKLVVIYRGYPGVDESLFDELASADVLLVGSPIMQQALAKRGMTSHLVYHSFDKRILDRLGYPLNPNPIYDLTFAGSTGFGRGLAQQDRFWFLKQLLDDTDLIIWGDEVRSKDLGASLSMLLDRAQHMSKLEFLNFLVRGGARKIRQLARERLYMLKAPPTPSVQQVSEEGVMPMVPLGDIYPDKVKGPAFGLELYQLFQQSKMTLNRHTDAARKGGYVDNMRLFQATGAGTCLVTDTGRNMGDLFEEDREVVVYSSYEECLEKVRYLLEHDDERREIAHRAQTRTLSEHEVVVRCAQIEEILKPYLAKVPPRPSTDTSKPTLSVVMANYNHAHYLPVALDAILSQSYVPLEIIVFDDCSSDGSWELLQEYAARHKHIRPIRNTPNRGVAYIMNQGLEEARGDFIYFAASDDKALPGFFEKTMALLERFPHAGLCTGMQRLMDERGKDLGIADTPCVANSPSFITPERAHELIYEHGYWAMGVPCIWNKQAAKDAGGYCRELFSQLDVYTAQVLALRHGACFIPDTLSQWRLRTDSFTNSSNSNLYLQIEIALKTVELMRGPHCDAFPKQYVDDYEERQLTILHSGLVNGLLEEQKKAVDAYFSRVINPSKKANTALYRFICTLLKTQKLSLKIHARLRGHSRRAAARSLRRKLRAWLGRG